jgi:hypothetical protein
MVPYSLSFQAQSSQPYRFDLILSLRVPFGIFTRPATKLNLKGSTLGVGMEEGMEVMKVMEGMGEMGEGMEDSGNGHMCWYE